jgi:hypothetical protein
MDFANKKISVRTALQSRPDEFRSDGSGEPSSQSLHLCGTWDRVSEDRTFPAIQGYEFSNEESA